MRTRIVWALLLAAIAASHATAEPLNVDVTILTGDGGSLIPSTHVPAGSTSSSIGDNPPIPGSLGSPLHHGSSGHATATLIYPDLDTAPSIAVGSATFINAAGALSVFNRSILLGIGSDETGAPSLSGSFRVQTIATGDIERTAVVSGANVLTLNIVNSALQLVDLNDGAFAQIQTIVTVTTANGVQSYTLNASLTNVLPDTGPLAQVFSEEEFIDGNVTSSGPTFSSFNGGTLYVAPGYLVTFDLGNLALGAPIDINYSSTTVALAPFAPDFPTQFVRAQFGDPDTQGGTNINPIVSTGAVTEASEPSALMLAGLCTVVGLFAVCRHRAAELTTPA